MNTRWNFFNAIYSRGLELFDVKNSYGFALAETFVGNTTKMTLDQMRVDDYTVSVNAHNTFTMPMMWLGKCVRVVLVVNIMIHS